jgi:KDO2-lipid IV(A) lauroyltransferase
MLGHLGNWEWTADIQHRFTNPQIQHYNVYRHLNNRSADAAMTAIREKRSGKGSNIEKNHLLRELVRLKKAQAMFTLGLVADQKPSPRNAHFHTTFLNQPTDFLTGGEVLAKKFDYVVTYVEITSSKRGYYTVRADLITDNAPGTRPDEITEQFAKRLEDNIRRQPQLWLWTHNRWKWSRQNQ